MNVMLNGEGADIAMGTTVASLVALVAPSPRGIAVAVNQEVVPRSLWATVQLAAGDRVEVLTASQGG